MAQYGLPNGDDANPSANWSEGAGDTDANWFDELDEGFGSGRGSGSGPDGATTYWTNDGTLAFWLSVDVSRPTDPGANDATIIRSHMRKSTAGGRQIDVSWGIYTGPGGFHGSVSIVGFQADVDGTFTTRPYTLTTGEEANLKYSFSPWRMGCKGDEVGGGSPKDPECSALEVECPDVSEGFAHSHGTII